MRFLSLLRIYDLGITKSPELTAAGYFLTAVGGFLASLVITFKWHLAIRIINALILLAATGIWAFIAAAGYWTHLASLSK